MSRLSPDRRPCCGKSSAEDYDLFFGPCGSHISSRNTSSYQTYLNVTTIPGMTSGSSASYATIRAEISSQPFCGDFRDYTPGDGVNGNYFEGVPPTDDVDTIPTELQESNGIYTNSYILGPTASLATCGDLGYFKKLYAFKDWWGRRPFNANAYEWPDHAEWCGACSYRSEITSPETTKYLTLECESNYEEYEVSSDVVIKDFASSAASTCTQGRYTGQISMTHASSSNTPSNPDILDEALDMIGSGDGNIGTIWQSVVNEILEFTWADEPTSKTGTYEGGAWELEYEFDVPPGQTAGAYWSINHAGGTMAFGYSYNDGEGSSGSETITLTISATQMSYTRTWDYDAPSGTWDKTLSWSATLSDPYTRSDVQADVAALLPYWDLGDDIKMPWRSDNAIMRGPLLSYNALGDSIQAWHPGHPGPNPDYDGSPLGKPTTRVVDNFFNPKHENYDICFDPTACGGTGGWFKFVNSYGARSHIECGTPCATQWTNRHQESMFPQALAFNGSNFFWTTPPSCQTNEGKVSDNVLWVCVGAERSIEKPSFNFARYCNVDRLQIISGSGYRHSCIRTVSGSGSGSVLTFEDYNTEPTTITSSDKVWICGVDDTTDGAWEVTKLGDYSIQLDKQLATASWYDPKQIIECGDGIAVTLKHWDTCPGICGRNNIQTANYSSSYITCSLKEAHYLAPGDSIVVSGSVGMVFDGVKSVYQVLDNHSVILTGSVTETGSYSAKSGQMYVNGATDWAHNDVGPKGYFTVLTHKTEFRDLYEYHRLATRSASIAGGTYCHTTTSCPINPVPTEPRTGQVAVGISQFCTSMITASYCLPYNPCKQRVVYCHPSTSSLLESRYNCKYVPWEWMGIDDPHGQMWQTLLIDADEDYAWQAPPCICGPVNINPDPEGEPILKYNCSYCTYQEDQWGTCPANVEGDPELGIPCEKYYANRPEVEAMTSIPDGAPTTFLSQIRYLTPADYSGVGRVFNPPLNTSHFNMEEWFPTINHIPYWSIYLTKQGCICGNGQFANQYRNGLIDCPSDEKDFNCEGCGE